MTHPEIAYLYAKNVIKGRWPEAESNIMKNQSTILKYVRDVIEGRWPEAEPTIMKSPYYAYLYATNIIKGRWPKAEHIIMKSTNKNIIKQYLKFLSDNEKIEFLKLYPHMIKYITISREIKSKLPGLVIAKKTGLLGLQNAEI